MTAQRAWLAVSAAVLLPISITACGGGDDDSGDNGGADEQAIAADDAQLLPLPGAQEGAPDEIPTTEDLASTFALDIDTASWGYASRTIRDGALPDPSTIRPEEFVNAFRQDYPEPIGNGFSVTVDGAPVPFADFSDARLLRVGLKTRAADSIDRPDAALTFVIDVSGSMAEPGRLDLVQHALHRLVDQLRPTDSVGIVAYSAQAQLVSAMTPVASRSVLHAAIDHLYPEESTNLEAGVVLGYQVARDGYRQGATNRVILLSDGLANVGNTVADPILGRVREEAGKGIALLCVGVGSEYGDELMERLADQGDGFAVYVSEPDEAERLFVDRLPATIELRALDAKAQVVFDPAAVASYRLIGYENRALAAEDFRDDRVDGGEVGPGHTVTALYEIRLRPGASGRLAEVAVRWLDPYDRSPAEIGRTVTVADLSAYDWRAASPWLQVSTVAAYFAEVLRGTDGAAADLRWLAGEADRLAGVTEDGTVAELADITARATALRG